MNISILFTGGTICTTVKDGRMSTDPTASAALTELFWQSDSFAKASVTFNKEAFLGILSENMTVANWNRIAAELRQILATRPDGIIVAHGTDTLAYSTALFSVLLEGVDIPVVFVSANRPLLFADGTPNPDSNGGDNFRAAVECMFCGLGGGVYATYKNPKDGRTYLHQGKDLLQCSIYDDNFYSRSALDITDVQAVSLPQGGEIKPPLLLEGLPLRDCVLKITPYVGMNYKTFALDGVEAVLHGTYHSGTACVNADGDASVLSLFDRCAETGIPFYYSPSQVGEAAIVYDSVPYIQNHCHEGQKVSIRYGETDEYLYARLLVAASYGRWELLD